MPTAAEEKTLAVAAMKYFRVTGGSKVATDLTKSEIERLIRAEAT